ncbi:MAG: AEC family transporter [Pseudomonadota bacterium]
MLQIITIVVPVFGLILLGWALVKAGYVSELAGKGLAEFAFKVAMPALLFRAVLGIGEWPSSPLNLVLAYFSAAAIIWILATLLTLFVLKRPAADAASLSMGSTFSNSVMLGIPLALSAFGPEAAAPAALLVSLDSPLLWIAATLHIASAQAETRGSPIAAIRGILLDLLKNPIVMALVLGSVGRIAGLELPTLVDKTVALIASSAVPAALFALGMSLATYKMAGQGPTLTVICVLKLVAFPALTFVMCVYVFDVRPLWTAIATLFAAMPVGANAYLFAARYDKAVGSVSTAIAVTTAIAVFSVSALLYWLQSVV